MNKAMNNAHTREVQFGGRAGSCHAAAPGAAGWLGLAAAPTFVVMALLTGVQSSGQPDIFCSAMHNGSPLGGMVPMYVLMAAFHLDPWLKLIFGRRSGARRGMPLVVGGINE
jgi:hypothetical protein